RAPANRPAPAARFAPAREERYCHADRDTFDAVQSDAPTPVRRDRNGHFPASRSTGREWARRHALRHQRLTELGRAALAVPDRALATRCPHGRRPRVLGAAPGRCRRIRPRARALGGRVAVHALAAALASRLHAPPRARRTPLRPLPPL